MVPVNRHAAGAGRGYRLKRCVHWLVAAWCSLGSLLLGDRAARGHRELLTRMSTYPR